MSGARARSSRGLAAAAALALACACAPVAAPARTLTVHVGLPEADTARFDARRTDVHAFFPAQLTIRTGDTLRFAFGPLRPLPRFGVAPPARAADLGIHAVDLPPRGGRRLGLLVATGRKAAARDAAGEPFWFRDEPIAQLNPKLRRPAPRRVVRYDGSRRVLTGVPRARRPRPLRVRFTKTGTFTFYCSFHPGMAGTAKVVGRRGRVSTAAGVRRAVRRQVAAAVRSASAVAGGARSESVVSVGRAGRAGVGRYVFSPSSLTIPRGRVLRFVLPKASREVHTATVGPGDPDAVADSYLRRLSLSVRSATPDPVAVFASDPPTLFAVSLTPKLHGNGFWSSGVLDADRSTPPPRDGRLRFATRGTFWVHCLIHPSMRASVTVR